MGCREYTLPRDDESSTPNEWIRGNTKICLVLDVATNYHQGKPGVEIRIDSLSGDGSQSWIRISTGLNKFVRDLTEKTRTLGDEEHNSTGTGQPVVQESRIVKYSQIGTYSPAAKAKPKPTSFPLSSPFTTSSPISEIIGLILNQESTGIRILKAFWFRRG